MICSNCKNEIVADSRFCEFCGVKLNEKILSHDALEKKPWHWRLRNALLVLVPFAWFVFAFFEGDLDKLPELLWFMVVSDLIVLLIYEAVIYVVYGASKGTLLTFGAWLNFAFGDEEDYKVENQKASSWHLRLRNELFVLVPFAWFVFAFFEGELDEFPELLLFMAVSDIVIFIVYVAIIYVVYGTSKK